MHPPCPRVLLFSTLYPSSVRPAHGIFVETRLRELLKTGRVQAQVVAPVPWFPFTGARWGDWGLMARTPARETWNGIEVWHPRYPLLPKVGMSSAPLLMALACLPHLRRRIAAGHDFDLIDAHYYYPDGVAAALLARWLGKPLAITARGTDLNLIPQHAVPRAMIRWASRQADASIGVCAALTDVLRRLGTPPQRLHVMRNGVDLERFRPLPPQECRARLGLRQGPVLLAVGHLIERKGPHLWVQAMPEILRHHPQARLVFVGDGPMQAQLRRSAAALGVADHVVLAGAQAQEALAPWYSAADVSLLASSREGWANVLLESMACGTPVVATRIWGTPEVVAQPEAGELVDSRTPTALAAGVLALLRRRPPPEAVRRYAERFAWGETAAAQLALFEQMASPKPEPAHA